MNNNKIDEVSDAENKSSEQNVGVVKSNKFNIATKIALYLINMAIMGLIGASAGYYAALTTPVANQVMVFDLDKVMGMATSIPETKNMQPKQAADLIVAQSKSKIKQYTDAGILVIDKSAVIGLPEHLMIPTDNIGLTGLNDTKSATKEDIELKINQMNKQLELLSKQK